LIQVSIHGTPDYDHAPYTYFRDDIDDYLRFSNTNESLFVNGNYNSIRAGPSKEYITTKFSMNNYTVERKETVTYGTYYAPASSLGSGFECVQSFAVVKNIVTDEIVQQWLNRNITYPVGGLKAAYGTFMTALTTLWLSDKLADEMASCLNVTWNRFTPTVVMAGVTGGKAYVHCQDPAMGMSINGDSQNVMFFRFVNSLMLSEIENGVLSSTGLQVNSTLSRIISGILNGEPFLFVLDEEANRLTLMLEGNEKFYIIIDLNTGLVLNIVDENGSFYKGATSQDNGYCFHDWRTEGVCKFVGNLLHDFANGLKDPHTAASTIGGILLVGACVASGPVGWALLLGGILLCAGGSGLLDDISGPNPGYKNPYNWLDFGCSLLFARVGASGAKAAAGPIIKNMGKKLAVSNVPIKGTLNPAKIATTMKFGKYEIMTSNQRIVRGALGRTETEQVLTFSEEYLKSTGISVIKDQAPPLPA
jgi:hypothetical protein